MVKVHLVNFRVTEDQHNRLKNNARVMGFRSVSAYLRDLGLRNSLIFEMQISAIYKTICQNANPAKTPQQNKSKPKELEDYAMPDEYDPFAGCGTQVEEVN